MEHRTCPLCGCTGSAQTLTADPVAIRFWSKVDVRGADQCWTWRSSKNAHGYGRFRMPPDAPQHPGKSQGAHRVAYWLTTGQWPADRVVRHACDNPACVNPAHLSLGTHADNVRDKISRGRQPVNANSLKIECKRGHSYTPENTGINSTTGNRYCRTCKRAWNLAWRTAH